MTIVQVEEMKIRTGGLTLAGDLAIPYEPAGMVILATLTASGRKNPRNRIVAAELQRRGLGTLLLDLLTPDEEAVDCEMATLRFDVDMLAPRLVAATHILRGRRDLPIGYFASDTGAAVALIAAAHHPDDVDAVVCRGGRPDLAISALPKVRAATLLIAGERDARALRANRLAFDHLKCEKKLEVIPDATNLFEEPGALELVSDLAGSWLATHLVWEPMIA